MKSGIIEIEDVQPGDSVARLFLRGVELVTKNKEIAEVIRKNCLVWSLMLKPTFHTRLKMMSILGLEGKDGIIAYQWGMEYGTQLVLSPPGCIDIGL